MVAVDPLAQAAAIGRYLDQLSAPWALGGSVASSLMGEPRSTNDVDVALRLSPSNVAKLVELLGGAYYAPVAALEDAAGRYDSFNLVHLSSGFKIDLFFLGESLLDRWQIERRQSIGVEGVDGRLWVTSPADLLLRKLWWYQLGGEVSDRQWNDVLSIVRVQGTNLDLAGLHADAQEVGLQDLLERALRERS